MQFVSGKNFKLCVEIGCGDLLTSELSRFFCDWVQDYEVKLI